MRCPDPPRLTSFRTALGSRPPLRPHTQIASRSLGLLLAIPLLPTATTRAAEPPTTTSPLRTTVAPSIDDAALFPQWLENRNPGLAHALALPGHTQWIAIDIDGATYDYQVTVTAFRDGAPLGPPAATLPCECNSEALLAMIDHEIDDAVEHLRVPPSAVDGPPAPNQQSRAPTQTAAPRRPPVPRTRRQWILSSLGIAGVATGAFGLIAIGAGTSLLVAPERQLEGYSRFYRELDPLGYTTLAVGLAALVGGITMTVIDIRRGHIAAHSRGQARAPRSSFGMTASHRRGAGLLLWARF